MSAIVTNVITDILLSIFIAYLAVISLIQRIKGDEKFTRFIVAFFFTLFVLTALGAVAHYLGRNPTNPAVKYVWLAISAGVVYLNYCLIYAIRVPESIRMLVIFLSLFFLYLFNLSLQFVFIALSLIFIYALAFTYTKQLTRIGFLAVILSNLIWIVIRKGINFELGYPLPVEYRYDNDVYHFLIIAAVYIIYKSIKIGDWSYPK